VPSDNACAAYRMRPYPRLHAASILRRRHVITAGAYDAPLPSRIGNVYLGRCRGSIRRMFAKERGTEFGAPPCAPEGVGFFESEGLVALAGNSALLLDLCSLSFDLRDPLVSLRSLFGRKILSQRQVGSVLSGSITQGRRRIRRQLLQSFRQS